LRSLSFLNASKEVHFKKGFVFNSSSREDGMVFFTLDRSFSLDLRFTSFGLSDKANAIFFLVY